MNALAAPPTMMAVELGEQPSVIEGLARRRGELAAAVQSLMPRPRVIALVGIGSSGNAADYGRYVFETELGIPATVVPPAAAPTVARRSYEGCLAIGISQSGETPEVISTIARLKAAGASTIAITNRVDSELSGLADCVVDLRAGTEVAVPATKSFTATIVALMLLSRGLDDAQSVRDIEELPYWIAMTVADVHSVERALDRIAYRDRWACIGQGPLAPIAAEIALKLEEVALVVADSHSLESFRHGPIATAGPCRPVVALVHDRSDDRVRRVLRDLDVAGSPVLVIGPDAPAELPVPEMPRSTIAVAAAVRGQQLALALGGRRGVNVDRPPGLTKVTR